jgi:hypothetical protein
VDRQEEICRMPSFVRVVFLSDSQKERSMRWGIRCKCDVDSIEWDVQLLDEVKV